MHMSYIVRGTCPLHPRHPEISTYGLSSQPYRWENTMGDSTLTQKGHTYTTELTKDESGDIKAELSETKLVPLYVCVSVCVRERERQMIECSDLTAQGLIRDLGHSVTPNILLRHRLLRSQTPFCQKSSRCVAKVTFRGTREVRVCACMFGPGSVRQMVLVQVGPEYLSQGRPMPYITESPPSELMASSAEPSTRQSQVLVK